MKLIKDTDELNQLKELRKSVFNVQQRFVDLVCGEMDEERTPLQKSFGLLIWEIDERIREIHKMESL